MLFNIALFSGLILAPAVLAAPRGGGLGARLAGRRDGRQSQPNSYHEQAATAASNSQYSKNWAGAVLDKGDGTFTSVTGTFTVPTPSGSTGSSAAAWVGIDGDTCQRAIFQTGVDFTVSSNGPTYDAWYEFFPAPASDFSGIEISAGDVIKLTVTISSSTAGTATIENLTNGQTVSESATAPIPLCGQNAEWIVEDYMMGFSRVPFANFGKVTFSNAVATGTRTYTPSRAVIMDIEQNNQVLTSTSISGSSVIITYV